MEMTTPGRSPAAESVGPPSPSRAATPPTPPATRRLVGALTLLALVLFGALALFRLAPSNGQAQDGPEPPGHPTAKPFEGWPKTPDGRPKDPDLALVFSGQSLGYLQPCGCSSPQYGGLARRFNFLQSLKDKKWKVVAVDVGDNMVEDDTKTQAEQALLKFQTGMRALEAMIYRGVGLSKKEYLTPLSTALVQHTLAHPQPPVLAANLIKTNPGDLWFKMNVRRTHVVEEGGFKVGILALTGPSVAKAVNEKLPPADQGDINFTDPFKALADGLTDLRAKKTNVGILLFQGEDQEAAQFVDAAYKLYLEKKAPLLHAVLCLDKFADPGAVAQRVPGIPTQIIAVGHKGKHVGVLGLFRNPTNLEMRYELVKIGPEFEPRDGDELKNPVLRVMQEYSDELKAKDYLAWQKRDTHPTQVVHRLAHFVGSDLCARCHAHASQIWDDSKHAEAYDTLVVTKFPTGRQYDPECILCHTVGYEFKTGYYDPPKGAGPKEVLKHNGKLQGVGCENCHGPCSEHVANTKDITLYPKINPYGPKVIPNFERRMNLIEWNLCQKCHDLENDVNWGAVGFEAKWVTRSVIHNTPGSLADQQMKAHLKMKAGKKEAK